MSYAYTVKFELRFCGEKEANKMGKNTKRALIFVYKDYIYSYTYILQKHDQSYHILNSGVSFAKECFKVLNKQGPCHVL